MPSRLWIGLLRLDSGFGCGFLGSGCRLVTVCFLSVVTLVLSVR